MKKLDLNSLAISVFLTAIFALLLFLITGCGEETYKTPQEKKLTINIDSLESQIDYLVDAVNHQITQREKAENEVLNLMEKVDALKFNGVNSKELQDKIKRLEARISVLKDIVAEERVKSHVLEDKLEIVHDSADEALSSLELLRINNLALEEQMSQNRLRIFQPKISPLKLLKSTNFKRTTKARQTNVIRAEFFVIENPSIPKGEYNMSLSVHGSNGTDIKRMSRNFFYSGETTKQHIDVRLDKEVLGAGNRRLTIIIQDHDTVKQSIYLK